MERSKKAELPDWLNEENVQTVVVAFADVYGRMLGKRMTLDYFLNNVVNSGMHACNYLLTVDIEMNPLPGFELASWDKGYGDFHIKPDFSSFYLLPWQNKTAIVVGDVYHEDGTPVAESPRQILAEQVSRLKEKGYIAFMGTELEFYLFNETYRSSREKGYNNLMPSSDYLIDYHILQTSRDEDVLAQIRNDMSAAGIGVECSKGEWGKGQHEVNLLYAEALEMADKHAIYKVGAKDIASQHGKALTFMSKIAADQAGNGFHLHTSIRDAGGKEGLFWDCSSKSMSRIFRQFVGGLLKYSRELTYFFAPTINSYKRYQHSSWAPTAIVCGHDNRTCGFRIVGHESSLRIENRVPCADANPYLAYAATIAAGLMGIEEDLDSGEIYEGNAYIDQSLKRLPESLEEASQLLDEGKMAREAFGDKVVDFYVHTASLEVQAFKAAVTDWERKRYFEQL